MCRQYGERAGPAGRAGAFHLYFRHDRPLGNSSKKLAPHIDVKADGGQVVFPGSVHPDTGVMYQWAEGFEPWNVGIAELPPHIVELLESPEPAGPASEHHHGPAAARPPPIEPHLTNDDSPQPAENTREN